MVGVSLSRQFQLTASELADEFEAYAMNKGLGNNTTNEVTRAMFSSFRSHIQNERVKRTRNAMNVSLNIFSSKEDILMNNTNNDNDNNNTPTNMTNATTTTPRHANKRHKGLPPLSLSAGQHTPLIGTATPAQDHTISSGNNNTKDNDNDNDDYNTNLFTSPLTSAFKQRSQKGLIQVTLDPVETTTLPKPWSMGSDTDMTLFPPVPLEIFPNTSSSSSSHYHYQRRTMMNTLQSRAQFLDNKTNTFAELMLKEGKLIESNNNNNNNNNTNATDNATDNDNDNGKNESKRELWPLTHATQEEILVCGRVCCDTLKEGR